MKTKPIRQVVFFKASPHEVYEMLMDSKKHSEFTGAKASISLKAGGKFSAYDGYIGGVNVELVQGERIVQKWRGSDWTKNHYSTAIFELEKIDKGTKLIFNQTGVPEEHHEAISKGWVEHYWDKMKKALE